MSDPDPPPSPAQGATRWPLVWLVTAAYVLSQANLARIVGPLDPNIVVLQTRLTPDAFWGVLAAWGPDGVARYRAHLPVDWLHPFLYGAMGWLWARRTPVLAGWPRAVAAMLPLAAACDLIENLAHSVLLAQAPGGGAAWVALGGMAGTCKWALAALFTLALGCAGPAWLARRWRGRQQGD